MKAVVYELDEWESRVWPKIIADYGKAVNVSWVCKNRLGFTVRRHTNSSYDDLDTNWNLTTIHLDFYDDASQTMFLLKYQ